MIYKNIKYSMLIIHNTLKIRIHKSLAHSCYKYLKIQTWNEMCVSLMTGLKQKDLKNTLLWFSPWQFTMIDTKYARSSFHEFWT